jgi:hypothetical protein
MLIYFNGGFMGLFDFETDEAKMSAADIYRAVTDGLIDGVIHGIPIRVGDNGETLAQNSDGEWVQRDFDDDP